jgi:hypothetical protein
MVLRGMQQLNYLIILDIIIHTYIGSNLFIPICTIDKRGMDAVLQFPSFNWWIIWFWWWRWRYIWNDTMTITYPPYQFLEQQTSFMMMWRWIQMMLTATRLRCLQNKDQLLHICFYHLICCICIYVLFLSDNRFLFLFDDKPDMLSFF